MSKEMIPVDAHRGLCRDAHSNAIVNTDHVAYEQALRARELRQKNKQELETIKSQLSLLMQRCDYLEGEMNRIQERYK